MTAFLVWLKAPHNVVAPHLLNLEKLSNALQFVIFKKRKIPWDYVYSAHVQIYAWLSINIVYYACCGRHTLSSNTSYLIYWCVFFFLEISVIVVTYWMFRSPCNFGYKGTVTFTLFIPWRCIYPVCSAPPVFLPNMSHGSSDVSFKYSLVDFTWIFWLGMQLLALK